MKAILIFGSIGLFAYVAFIPPDGMRKLPVARVEFTVTTSQGSMSTYMTSAETEPADDASVNGE